MNADTLITQLQIFSGGAMVMSTAQLATCLAMNPKVISRMRQEGRFPIKEKMIGAKIVYTLDTIAKYLLDDRLESTSQPTQVISKIAPEKKRASTPHAPVQDLSRKMLRLAFVAGLEKQIKQMEYVATFFVRSAAYDQLESVLPVRDNHDAYVRPFKP